MRMRALPSLLLAAVLAGCGGTTTSVVLQVAGADTLGGDQLHVVGSVDGVIVHSSTVPAPPRALAAHEDLRILFPDDLAGRIAIVQATVLRRGACVAVQEGYGVLVLGKPKQVDVAFTASTGGCTGSSDGGTNP